MITSPPALPRFQQRIPGNIGLSAVWKAFVLAWVIAARHPSLRLRERQMQPVQSSRPLQPQMFHQGQLADPQPSALRLAVSRVSKPTPINPQHSFHTKAKTSHDPKKSASPSAYQLPAFFSQARTYPPPTHTLICISQVL